MIKFFRKIRQTSIAQSKVGRYLLYALGEIILVVIGILIALQINTWKNQQRISKEETATLVKLVNDLNRDNKHFKSIIKTYNDYGKELTTEKNLIYKNNLTDEEIKLAAGFGGARILNLNPRRVTYNEMLNSGRIYNLSNQVMLDKIIEYYQLLEDNIYNNKTDRKEYRALFYGPELTDYWYWRSDDNWFEYAKVFFQNQDTNAYHLLKQSAGWGLGMNTQKLNNTTDILKLNNELLEIIHKELNSKHDNDNEKEVHLSKDIDGTGKPG
jgi:hypothetical protein